MRRDYFFRWAGLIGTGVALALLAPAAFIATVAVGVVSAFIYWAGRCRHGDRLGLLPPLTADDGTRIPARWYCDTCGRVWPAGLERDVSPVVRFSGYDQSKFPASARRAAAVGKQRQALAVRRAGHTTPRVAAPAAANVTSIAQRRVAR